MDRRYQEKRRHDGDHYQQFPKKPRFDNQSYSQSPKANGQNNGVSRHAKITVELPNPLPTLPPVTPQYEDSAFTHVSRAIKGKKSYERLEFIGDAEIELAASHLIHSRYPDIEPGRMSSIREMMVKNETLAEYSLAYGFDKRISIEPGARPTNRVHQLKLHGDVFEAYVAAVVFSAPDLIKGRQLLQNWLIELWGPLLRTVQGEPPNTTAKDDLKKRIGSKGVMLNYVEERPVIHGKGIETYFVGVYLTGLGYDNQHLGSGKALSKKAAGMEAALSALKNHPLIDELIAKNAKILEEQRLQKEREEAGGVAGGKA